MQRFAMRASSALSAAPADTEVKPPRRSLPTPSSSLLGREAAIADVSSLLESTDARLVTLTGPGGIGKTRLAIAVGAALDEAGRTEFVPLVSITDPALVLPRVAAAVGAPIEGTRSALDTLIEHLAQTPTLLVLDNLEQVTGVATELDQLLAACPAVTILATAEPPPRRSARRARRRGHRPSDLRNSVRRRRRAQCAGRSGHRPRRRAVVCVRDNVVT
jgi:hypothetical protein